jgi:hypothetical protein
MTDPEQTTFFHLPGDVYEPGRHDGPGKTSGSHEGFLFLPVGAIITLEGHRGRFRVVGSQFHLGHPSDGFGMHYFLEPE